ncbi:MAG TPA: hypothetical protein VMK16_13200 [Acidimicrobiales bacterium]|nr:hypothetical protein [Acidimicrobiales bacterium]
MTSSALPELELLDTSAVEPERGVEVHGRSDRRGWWPVVAAAGVVAALVITGRNGDALEQSAPAPIPPPVATTVSATPPESFSIVMTDSLSRRMVMVDPRGRAVRLAMTADPAIHPLDIAAPSPLDVSLGGLPQGRRPVAVLDKSIVLVPAATAGPPVELWGGGVNLHVLDGVGRFVAASDDRVATVDTSCTSCTMRISSSGGQLVREIDPFTGFQPVSTGSFSPDGAYVAVRFAEAHRPFDGVAIADVAAGTMEPLLGVGGDDALAMAWSPDSILYLLGPIDVLRYQPGVGITGRIPIVDWRGGK